MWINSTEKDIFNFLNGKLFFIFHLSSENVNQALHTHTHKKDLLDKTLYIEFIFFLIIRFKCNIGPS